jgi:hypothetical protein
MFTCVKEPKGGFPKRPSLSALEDQRAELARRVEEMRTEEAATRSRLETLRIELEQTAEEILRIDAAINVERQLRDPQSRLRVLAPLVGTSSLPRDPTGRLARVVEILEQDTARAWSPRELHAALSAGAGEVGSLHALRVQLSRWVRDGVLVREGHGSYRLAWQRQLVEIA